MASPRDVDDWGTVETLQDFVSYLLLLQKDFEQDAAELKEEWAHGNKYAEGRWRCGSSVGDLFESWAAWMHDRYLQGPPQRRPTAEVEPLTWSALAFQLRCAGDYE